MVRRYIRDGSLFRENSARKLGCEPLSEGDQTRPLISSHTVAYRDTTTQRLSDGPIMGLAQVAIPSPSSLAHARPGTETRIAESVGL
jgi:hypothetical protein